MAKSLLRQLDPKRFPQHIGIIMDGNGRWAKERGLPRKMGHRYGAEAFTKLLKYCRKLQIPYLTAYMFSTENWKRPQDEVDAIMDLLRQYLDDLGSYEEENARLRFLGERGTMPADIQEKMNQAEKKSAHRTGIQINLALNYGGREELLHATRELARQCLEGSLTPEEITEQLFSNTLYTAGMPDPDLILRPSGEKRLSNFLPWQTIYAELVFMDVLWPDFTPAHLDQAILEYAGRSRRFGGV